jgi:hypothetical protein
VLGDNIGGDGGLGVVHVSDSDPILPNVALLIAGSRVLSPYSRSSQAQIILGTDLI